MFCITHSRSPAVWQRRMHSCIIRRDMEAGGVIVTSESQVKILDFGPRQSRGGRPNFPDGVTGIFPAMARPPREWRGGPGRSGVKAVSDGEGVTTGAVLAFAGRQLQPVLLADNAGEKAAE